MSGRIERPSIEHVVGNDNLVKRSKSLAIKASGTDGQFGRPITIAINAYTVDAGYCAIKLSPKGF